MNRLALVMGTLLILGIGTPSAGEEKAPVDEGTKAKVRQEIERYVASDTLLKRYFFIIDPRSDKVLRLTFDHVHDGVSVHPMGYIACADFKDKAGKLYDVDIVVDATEEPARVREILLHKVEGKPIVVKKTEAK
jgi:hypothetical protein